MVRQSLIGAFLSTTLTRALAAGAPPPARADPNHRGRAPQEWHDGLVTVGPGAPTQITVNFLLNQVAVNGVYDWFNGKDFHRR